MSIDLSELGLDGFNPEEYESADFEAIPAGHYTVIMTEAKWKETSSGTGRYLECTFQVVEGDYKNRKLWGKLNLQNPKPDAVTIAKRQFADICKAVQVASPRNVSELFNKPLSVRVTIQEWNGDKRNEVKAYKPLGAAQAKDGDDGGRKPPSSWMQT
jgi:hypothetical protein